MLPESCAVPNPQPNFISIFPADPQVWSPGIKPWRASESSGDFFFQYMYTSPIQDPLESQGVDARDRVLTGSLGD